MGYLKTVCLLLTLLSAAYGQSCSGGAVSDRVDCGDVTTTPDGCTSSGCCWNVTDVSGAPNCYYPFDGPPPPPPPPPPAPGSMKVYVHMMPWFETKDSAGAWGIHWTMANKNPDNVDANGKHEIASYYYPIIGPYWSGDPDVIDWQLGLMKTAGLAGVLVDWPGTSGALDYAGNLRNAEAIIDGAVRNGIEFGVVYEDHNLDLAGIGDKIGQATADMSYIQTNYISKGNFATYGGIPLLLDFGPQTLFNDQWDQVFTPFSTKPVFLVLADKDLASGGSSCVGGYAWVWPDGVDGLNNNIYNKDFPVMMGVAYPGFNDYYADGGWPPIGWKLPVGPDTFQSSFDLALQRTDVIQIATWNDYGEGTVIEPTDEFQYTYLEIIQDRLGSPYNVDDLKQLTEIFHARKKYAHDPIKSFELKRQHFALINKHNNVTTTPIKVTRH